MANPPTGKPFTKGVSGNPGGRSKAYRELARYIREKTEDGKKLADVAFDIAMNAESEPRVRLLAIDFLADRGIGKPVQAVDLRVDGEGQTAEATIDWAAVPLEKREALLEALSTLDDIAVPADTEADERVEH